MLLSTLRNGSGIQEVVVGLLCSLMVIFVCMPLRDFICAHIAVKLGDYSPRYNGRLTINPLAHIDPIGAAMMLLFGFGFGKGALYNPYNFKNPKKGILIISLAGPLCLLLLGFFFFILFETTFYFFATSSFGSFISVMLLNISVINICLAAFHLIPIPPMDGGRILFYFLPDRYTYAIRPYERYLPLVVLLLVYSGVLSVPLGYVMDFFVNLFDKIIPLIDYGLLKYFM